MKKSLFLLVIIICFSAGVHAEIKKWTWKQYGLSFSAPDNLKVTVNDASNFEASNDALNLSIEVMEYDGANKEAMTSALSKAAIQMGMSKKSDIGELSLTTLEGIYIDGSVEGVSTSLVLLFDTESNIALLGTLVYTEDQEQIATDIVNSFTIK